jgi:hypothetical protein
VAAPAGLSWHDARPVLQVFEGSCIMSAEPVLPSLIAARATEDSAAKTAHSTRVRPCRE